MLYATFWEGFCTSAKGTFASKDAVDIILIDSHNKRYILDEDAIFPRDEEFEDSYFGDFYSNFQTISRTVFDMLLEGVREGGFTRGSF